MDPIGPGHIDLNLNAIRRVVPELLEVLRNRVQILERIYLLQPIGRRALAARMHMTERVLRAELDFLRDQGLILAATTGVSLSAEGQNVLDELESVVGEVEGRNELAQAVSVLLNIPTVLVVAGDSDEEDWVKDQLGHRAATFLRANLVPMDVLAVTGGTTVAAMAQRLPEKRPAIDVKVVPARGGFGETVAVQANTIASLIAQKLGGTSTMLHVPDQLSKESYEQMIRDPHVQERLNEIRVANVVVHGIGDAMQMAKRRQVTDDQIDILEEQHAVAEAFGYYFNSAGQVAYKMTTVGLQLPDVSHMRLVMALAGGRRKAPAVAAAAKAYRIDVLVTDEGTAKQLLAQIKRSEEE